MPSDNSYNYWMTNLRETFLDKFSGRISAVTCGNMEQSGEDCFHPFCYLKGKKLERGEKKICATLPNICK